MGKGQGSLRRTAMIGAFVASVMLALILPSIAFATVYSGLTPNSGSSSSVSKPNISVICRDDQGIIGASNTSMTLDGVKVAKKLTWYSGWGHRKFKITYAVPSALSLGSHTVVVRVDDRKHNHSSKTWHFHVVDRLAPSTMSDAASWNGKTGPATINLSATDNAGGSGVAHTYYKLNGGAQTEGIVITASALGFYTLEFWSVDNAGNTESPHTAYFQVSAVPVPPTPDPIEAAHQSTEWCGTQSGCHVSSLLVVHSASRCAVCHGDGPTAANAVKYGIISTAAVKAAVAAGNTDCTACHNVFNTVPTHPFMTATTHTVNNGQPTGCYDPKCHASTDVSVIHTNGDDPPGCAACHAPGKTPSLVCGTCHPNLAEVHGFAHANASGTKSTACTACHGTDLPIVHTNVGCICHTASFLRAEMTPLLAAKTAECVDCHKGNYAAHGFNGLPETGSSQLASGHNTTTYGTIGAKTKFDGSQGVTLNWESEIASATLNPAYSTALGASSLTIGQVGVVNTTWDFPTVNVFWTTTDTAAPATAIKGLTKDSVITCQDCHAGLNAAGPHGSSDNWALDTNYPGDYSYAELTKWIVTNPAGIKVRSTLTTFTVDATTGLTPTGATPYYSGGSSASSGPGSHAVICAKCHDLENFNSGTTFGTAALPWWNAASHTTTTTVTPYVNTAAVGASNTAHASHHQDQVDGSPQCVNCHIGVPHGWNAPRLLVDTDVAVAPYLDPDHLGTTRATSTGEQNTGVGVAGPPDTRGLTGHPGFNGQGMQSLSAVDQHTLTNGAAMWGEPNCQACGDHPGEDGVRIQNGE